MVLTQRGRGVAVLMDVHEFELMQERLEFSRTSIVPRNNFAAGGACHMKRRGCGSEEHRSVKVEWSPLALDRVSDIARHRQRQARMPPSGG